MKPINLLLSLFFSMIGSVSIVAANPISLSLTIDEEFAGRAVLSGNIFDTVGLSPSGSGVSGWVAEVTGNNWWFKLTVRPSSGAAGYGSAHVTSYSLLSEAIHITNQTGLHYGEASPGLLIGENDSNEISTSVTPTWSDAFDKQDDMDFIFHPGSINHYDYLYSHLDDLNGSATGYLTTGGQISARFDLQHTAVPEPSTYLFFFVGCIIFAISNKMHNRNRY